MAVAFNDDTHHDFNLAKARVQKATLTGTATQYFSVRPGYYTTVQINKGASTATLKATCDFTPATNVDDAVFSTIDLSTGTDDYQNGHSAGLTGFEVDLTAFVGNCVIIVTEYKVL